VLSIYNVLLPHFCDRNEKELLKALETPEEKRARRLAKKVAWPFLEFLISDWMVEMIVN